MNNDKIIIKIQTWIELDKAALRKEKDKTVIAELKSAIKFWSNKLKTIK